MHTALRCLTDQIESETRTLRLIEKCGVTPEEGSLKSIDEHMFLIESLMDKKKLLEIRVRAIERALRALSELERQLLSSFYFVPYDKALPIRLMEQFSYEKTQLYHKRGQALEKFAENYNGQFAPYHEEQA